VWALSALAWLAMALVFLPQFVALTTPPGAAPAWGRIATLLAATFVPWALLTPPVLAFVAWRPLRAPWARSVAWHGAGALAIVSLQLLGMQGLKLLAGATEPFSQAWPRLLLGFGATGLLIYVGLVALGMARESAARVRETQRQLASAELRALKSQLQPHFLFNALNAIAELGYSDPRRAESVTLRLAGMLRRVLAGQQQEGITLADELVLAEDGLAIHHALLGERLRCTIDVPAELRTQQVPPLLLQPLVENAVRHGVAPHPEGGEVRLIAQHEGPHLVLDVLNTGQGLPPTPRPGLGLDNVRRRLAVLHGDAATLELGTHGGWTRARLRLPIAQGSPVKHAATP
jgi:two-component system, LytTR family, sensor kinase